VIVIPAQNGESPAMLQWIRASAKTADVTLSVCTGAYVLARTGLLSGREATTHYNAYAEFARLFPDIGVKRGAEVRGRWQFRLLGPPFLPALIWRSAWSSVITAGQQAERTADMMEYRAEAG
jgi:hypothetical protein